jgi:ABC-type multidrug transport system fused ATPase/permease subunit
MKSTAHALQPFETDQDISLWGLLAAFWKFLGKFKLWYTVLAIFSLAIGSFQSIFPLWAIGTIATMLIEGNRDITLLLTLVAGTAVAIFISNLIYRFITTALRKIQLEVQKSVRIDGFRMLVAHPYTWHQQTVAGQKIQRLNQGISDLVTVFQYMGSRVFSVVSSILSISIALALLNWIYIPLLLVIFVAITLNERYYYAQYRKAVTKRNKAREVSSGSFSEAITNVFSIKALGIQDELHDRIAKHENKYYVASIDMVNVNHKKSLWFFVIRTASMIGVVSLLVLSVVQGQLAAAMLMTYFMYYTRIFGSLDELTDVISDLTACRNGVARMVHLFDTELPPSGSAPFPEHWQKLECSSLHFSYATQSGSTALADISLSVQRGTRIGIVGVSGSGKSTLSKLLLGLYEPSSGTISIDSTPIHTINPIERSKHITAVPQETELFNGTVTENITLFTDAHEENLNRALSIAQLSEVVAALPDGMNTLIGEKGYKLSGGQRQRLGIARAIYSGAEIIILDEATASLDNQTEVYLQNALDAHLTDRTLIVIAHRLSTLRNVDAIYVFHEGQLVEVGTFDELLTRNDSLFKQQYELQQVQSQQ